MYWDIHYDSRNQEFLSLDADRSHLSAWNSIMKKSILLLKKMRDLFMKALIALMRAGLELIAK